MGRRPPITVDARTGHVALLDYVVVDDVGRAVNPLTLHGQMIGATVQGLGGVFGEQLSYDAEGQLLLDAGRLSRAGSDRLSKHSCRDNAEPSIAKQSSGCERRGRRRNYPDRGCCRERCRLRVARFRHTDQHTPACAAVHLGVDSALGGQPAVVLKEHSEYIGMPLAGLVLPSETARVTSTFTNGGSRCAC